MGKIKTVKKMNYSQAKQIDIVAFLSKIGFYSDKIRGNSVWYLSPLRSEKTASFKVDTDKNLFIDFSTGVGGSIIDLVMQLNDCEAKQALEILSKDSFSFHQPIKNNIPKKNYSIKKVIDLENNHLINYLKERKINIDLAKKYCCQVHYSFNHKKEYYGIGFKNDLEGFEIRNKFFKGCLGRKSITTILNQSSTASLFESWSDFLSYLTLKEEIPNEDFIILNSTSLIKKTEEILNQYSTIKVLFDDDTAGNNALDFIKKKAYCKVLDCSIHYSGYKDLNDYLVNLKK
tara:strand:- start:2361 stop:3224 length:864 start_codon:yes stop_codon:yes gene_type:complete